MKKLIALASLAIVLAVSSPVLADWIMVIVSAPPNQASPVITTQSFQYLQGCQNAACNILSSLPADTRATNQISAFCTPDTPTASTSSQCIFQ